MKTASRPPYTVEVWAVEANGTVRMVTCAACAARQAVIVAAFAYLEERFRDGYHLSGYQSLKDALEALV